MHCRPTLILFFSFQLLVDEFCNDVVYQNSDILIMKEINHSTVNKLFDKIKR